MENQFLPYVIYKNIEKFALYRKLKLVHGAIYPEKSRSETYLSGDEFTKNIQYYEYILLEFKDSPDKERIFSKQVHSSTRSKEVETFILILNINSIYSQTSQSFVKLLNRIPNFDNKQRNKNLDIIIISYNELNIHLMKKIESFIFDGNNESGFIHLYPYKYLHFSSERPLHYLVAPQRILSKKETDSILEYLYTNKKNLPKIKKNDVIAIWLGAEIGNVIEALMQSEISGIETKYLLVRP